MYEQIAWNVRKSYFLIFLVVALVVLIGYVFAEYTGNIWILPLAVAFATFSSVTGYYYSDRIVLSISRARPATKPEHAHYINSVEGLSIAAGLPVPRTYVIDDASLNAFATGRDPQHAAICVTKGLLDKLNRMELEGVIAHEMAHIKNYDIRLSTMVAVVVGIVVLLSDLMFRSMWWGGHRRRRSDKSGALIAVVGLILAVLAPLAAMAIKAAVSRQREYLADASGALLTRYPPGLASALEKIAADTAPLVSANKATAHLYIANPLRYMGGGMNHLFNTHPPIEERIRRLQVM